MPPYRCEIPLPPRSCNLQIFSYLGSPHTLWWVRPIPKMWGWARPFILSPLLGPVPMGARTIALDPTFGSFTLIEPVSHQVNQFLWWKCLDCLDWNRVFWCSDRVHLYIGRASVFVMPCFGNAPYLGVSPYMKSLAIWWTRLGTSVSLMYRFIDRYQVDQFGI
jgi:hypothetical protein